MPVEQAQQLFLVLPRERDERDELIVHEALLGVEQEARAARHPRPEIAPVGTEHDDGASGHVLARVIADTLHNGRRTRVAHRETLTRATGAVQLTAGRAIEDGVAEQAGVAGVTGGRSDQDPASAHRLPDVVVRFADEGELDAGCEEGAEALPGRALEAGTHAAVRSTRAGRPGDLTAEASADGAIRIGDRVARLDEPGLPHHDPAVRGGQGSEPSAPP